MWQAYSLTSLTAGAFETVVDKAGIVHDNVIDSYVASFYRLALFGLMTSLLGITGLLGELTIFLHWSTFALGIMAAFSTVMFTYLLRTVELTVIGAAAYLTPLLFLLIDTSILKLSFTSIQLFGIVLLVLGGLAFSLDGKTHHFKKYLSGRVWGIFFFIYIFYSGVEAYTYRYLHTTYDLSPVSFYATYICFGALLLFGVLVFKGRTHLLISRPALRYIPYAAAGKAFDSVNSTLYITAISMATVSQVSAFNALMPLVLVAVAWVVQGVFGVRLKEHLDYRRLSWKIGAAMILVIGGFLVV